MNLLQILLGQIPEAIYFALFMILTKSLKEKRIMFILLNVLEYILLLNLLPYSMWAHILYFVLLYIILKMLYKDKCRITDVFTLGIASIFMIAVSALSYFFTYIFMNDMIIGNIIQKGLLFVVLALCTPLLPKIETLYSKLWNRGKHKYKMKSTTFRALNVVIFNASFYIINLGIIFHSLYWR